METRSRFAPFLRLGALVLVAGAAFFGLRAFLAAERPAVAAGGGFATYSPRPEDGTRLLAAARLILAGRDPGPVPAPVGGTSAVGQHVLVLALSQPERTARVAEGRGKTVAEALARASEGLGRTVPAPELATGRLRLEVLAAAGTAEAFDERGRIALEPGLEGLYLPGEDLLLLPAEIVSRGLVDDEGDLQSKRLSRYLAEGHRGRGPLEGNPGRAGAAFQKLRFASFVEAPGGSPALPLYRGNVLGGTPTAADLLWASRAGGDYLVRHQLPEGSFNYLYRADTDSVATSYNLLRHAGSCYALFELFGATNDPRYLAAGQRGVEYLLTQVKGPRSEHADRSFEAIAPPDEEAKLGGAALAILAILEHHEVTGDDRWLDRAGKLAEFMLFMQEASGRFESKYFYDLAKAEPFESIYYPGEAILAFTRLHDATGQKRYLEAAHRGARWLIDVRDASKSTPELPHDHWLLMGLAEIHPKTKDAKLLNHAQRIAEAILGAEHRNAEFPDWNGGFYDPPRATPTATRGEALVAMHRLALANNLDPEPYRAALLRFAAFQLRCQITPENAFFLPRPDRALGGLRSGLADYEVRIDYVQHSVSAWLGLRGVLLRGGR